MLTEAEGLIKVTLSYVHCESDSVSEAMQDRDVFYCGPLIGGDI